MQSKKWNNGKPVWNKGRVRPAELCKCSECGAEMFLPTGSSGSARNIRYRFHKNGVAYCSGTCRENGKASKMSKALKGHPGYKPSAEGLARRILANTGNSWNLGKKHSEIHRQRLCAAWKNSPESQAHLARLQQTYKGPNSPHWKGGVTSEHRLARQSLEGRQWSKAVKERDNYTCQMCGQRGGELHSDHIKSFHAFPDLRWVLSNGRTLCKTCHRATPTYGRRKAA